MSLPVNKGIETKDWSQVSGQVKVAYYNKDRQSMIVEFKSGGIYAYLNVPIEVWNKSLNASSIGKFLNTDVKPYYKVTKLN